MVNGGGIYNVGSMQVCFTPQKETSQDKGRKMDVTIRTVSGKQIHATLIAKNPGNIMATKESTEQEISEKKRNAVTKKMADGAALSPQEMRVAVKILAAKQEKSVDASEAIETFTVTQEDLMPLSSSEKKIEDIFDNVEKFLEKKHGEKTFNGMYLEPLLNSLQGLQPLKKNMDEMYMEKCEDYCETIEDILDGDEDFYGLHDLEKQLQGNDQKKVQQQINELTQLHEKLSEYIEDGSDDYDY
jgi:hypothetical protein